MQSSNFQCMSRELPRPHSSPFTRTTISSRYGIADLVGGDQARPHGVGVVEVLALARAELAGHLLGLLVARGEVVEDGVAEDVLARLLLRDVLAGLADVAAELELEIQALGVGRPRHLGVRARTPRSGSGGRRSGARTTPAGDSSQWRGNACTRCFSKQRKSRICGGCGIGASRVTFWMPSTTGECFIACFAISWARSRAFCPAFHDLEHAGESRQGRDLGAAVDQHARHRRTRLPAGGDPKRHEFHAVFDNTLRNPRRRSMRQFTEDNLTDEVVARLKKTKDKRLQGNHDQRGEASARLRARSESDRGGMVRGHQVPDRGRARSATASARSSSCSPTCSGCR